MWLLLIVSVFLLILFYFIKQSRYWKSRGIPGPTPLPFVGNIGANIVGKKGSPEIFADIYKEYPDYPFVGIFRMNNPCLLLRDPEIIKNVVVKDFSYFVNNDIFIDKEVDPLLGRNPFVLKGEEWKKERQFLTSNFAPSKVKSLFPLVDNVGRNMVKYLESKEGVTINAKELCGKYTCDSVAVSAFGIEGNSFEDSNAHFFKVLKNLVSPDSIQGLKMGMSFILPNFLTIKLAPKSFDDNMLEITKSSLKYRKENNIKRNDYFDAVSHSPEDSLVDIAGHVGGFVLEGYETTSTAMTFMIYELATHPECQTKLREEINSVLEKHNGNISHEAIQNMVYLDACISESLRMHPPLAVLAKTCNKTYNITSNSNEFKNISATVEPGISLIVPLLGLHMDPKYYPSPEKFLPERFLDKTNPPKVYMPFGVGPRMCLGSRIASLQTKVGLTHLIKNFEITLDRKTNSPLKYDPFYFLLNPKKGAWVKFQKIDS